MLKHIKSLLVRNSFLIAVSLTLIIAYLSLSKPIEIDIPIKITFLDKILHASAYFTLTVSWLFALRKKSNFKLISIVLFLYGILMEFLQGWLTTTRQKDIYDVFANSLGIVISLFVFDYFYKYLKKIFDS